MKFCQCVLSSTILYNSYSAHLLYSRVKLRHKFRSGIRLSKTSLDVRQNFFEGTNTMHKGAEFLLT